MMIPSLLLSLIIGQSSLALEGITITRTTSDKQIEAAESQIQKEYGFKADIQAVQRNQNGEITELTCTISDKSGSEATCSSDNFGTLVIHKNYSCSISDQK